jgi:hypothetical protein
VLRLTAVLLAFTAPTALVAQEADSTALLIWGDGWQVTVDEPVGWHGAIEPAAQWGANLVLYRDSSALATGVGLIRVLVGLKADEHVEADLASDMEQYRARYPSVRFEPLRVHHRSYQTASRVFVEPGQFREYVTYLNPGVDHTHFVSVAFNWPTEPAPADLDAYRAVVASVRVVE